MNAAPCTRTRMPACEQMAGRWQNVACVKKCVRWSVVMQCGKVSRAASHLAKLSQRPVAESVGGEAVAEPAVCAQPPKRRGGVRMRRALLVDVLNASLLGCVAGMQAMVAGFLHASAVQGLACACWVVVR
eukprot:366345-Chlamydomonas_euryale.AAC.4